MKEKETTQEVGENTSNNLDQTVSSAEQETEKIDDRVKELVGEEEIKQAFSEQEESKEEDEEEAQDDQQTDAKENNDQQETQEEKTTPNVVISQEYKPSRLEKRIVNRYIHNLHLQGFQSDEIPSEKEIYEKLKGANWEEKRMALENQLNLAKQLEGNKDEGVLTKDDIEALKEEEREEIRREIIQEEETKATMRAFISFLDEHPELDEEKEEYDPVLTKAVESLFRDGNGMKVDEAYSLVVNNLNQVKEAKAKEERKRKNVALSGAMSGAGKSENENVIDWDYVDRISKSDPDRYTRELRSGKYNHLNL